MSGRVVPESYPGKTMVELKAMLKTIFANAGDPRVINIVDESLLAYFYGAVVSPRKDVDGVWYEVSFSFGEIF